MTAKTTASKSAKYWALLRIVLGLIFVWAFVDKLYGLGYTTCRDTDPKTKVETIEVMCDKAAINGGSPTSGFLKFGTYGPLQDFYSGLAGNGFVDFLFMAGLGSIGICLILGIGIRIATLSGVLMMLMMWSAMLPPKNNPLLDEHIVYSIALLGILASNKEQVYGLGKWWQSLPLVKKYSILA